MKKIINKNIEEERLPFVVSKKPVLAGGMLSKYADKSKWKKEKTKEENKKKKKKMCKELMKQFSENAFKDTKDKK